MSDILSKICSDKRTDTARRKQLVPLREIMAAAGKRNRADPPRGFAARLKQVIRGDKFGLIAEIKRASPSKGLIRADFDPPELARAYRRGGATCISVLTDKPYFQGSDEFLTAVRSAVDLPVLRKDFILEPYQVYESRAIGADCILMIMAALEEQPAREIAALARDLEMDVMAEVHDELELDRALQLGVLLIGINNKNLKTLAVDLAVTEELGPRVPLDRILVAESGITAADDLERMHRAGASVFLVGETLMRQPDIEEATRALLGKRSPLA
jgi:indole-3-glycerol phosphate synthase